MHRIFVPAEQFNEKQATIIGSDVHHISHVLRLEVGDSLEIRDSAQRVYATLIESVSPQEIICKIEGLRNIKSESSLKITLAQCLPKGKKIEEIIQHGTELGLHAVIPVVSERSIPRLTEETAADKRERWQKIAKGAAEQSGRLMIPTIHAVQSFKDVLRRTKEFDAALFFSEVEAEQSLKTFLQKNSAIQTALFLIGPEGGFSSSEIEAALATGFQSVTMGRRILRVETAALAALAMMTYEREL